jgi:hypothetical protein
VLLLLASRQPDVLVLVETHTFRDFHIADALATVGYDIIEGFETEPHPDAPHASGGISVVYKQSLFGKIQLVQPSRHYCWYQITGVFPLPLFFAACYFPQSSSVALHAETYNALKIDLDKLKQVGLTLLAGDFNARTSSNSDNLTNGAGRKLLEFAHGNQLSIINRCGCCSGAFTRLERGQHTSIDYAMCDRFCREFISAMRIMPQSDPIAVKSDHCLLELLLEKALPHHTHDARHGTAVPSTSSPVAIRHPLYRSDAVAILPPALPSDTATAFSWQNADASQLSALLTDKLGNFQVESKQLESGDLSANRLAARQLCDSFLKSIHESVRKAVPRKLANTQRKKTGKSSFMRDPSYRALMKRRLRLLKSDKPLTEEERLALRRCNTMANQRARSFLRSARYKDWRDAELAFCQLKTSRSFWAKLHRLRRGNSDASSRPIAHTVIDANGATCTGALAVLNVWKLYFESTYWLPPSTSEPRRREEAEMQATIDTALQGDSRNPSLDKPFSSSEVEATLKQAENGKAPGEDNIPYEFFKQYFDKENAPLLFAALTSLFNLLLSFSIWPEEFSRGIIAPIYKRKGNRLHPNVFRPISLLACLSKLYELLLNGRISRHVETRRVLSEEQAGFRPDRSTHDHILILDTIVTTAYEQKETVYAAFLDIEKAYDRTWRLRLLVKLLEAGVTGRVFKSIYAMLLNGRRSVRIGTLLSDWFTTNCGVPQGSILSPILFDIFVDDIIKHVNATSLGVLLGDRRVCCLLYADDIVLISNSPTDLQRMLNACQKFADLARFKFNISKSNIVVFSRSDDAPRPPLVLNNQQLAYVPDYPYLGMEFGAYIYRRKDSRWELYIKRIIDEATRRSREVLSIAGERDSQNGLPIHISLLYYYTHVRSRLEYACQVWGPLIASGQQTRLEAVQNDFLKRTLRLPKTTPEFFFLGELDVMPLYLRHEEQALRMWGKICTMPPERLPRIAQLHYLQHRTKGRGLSTWFHAMYKLITDSYPSLARSLSGSLPTPEGARDPRIDPISKAELTRQAWYSQVATAVRERWILKWQSMHHNLSSLRYYIRSKKEPALESWMKDTNHSGIYAKLLLRLGKLLNTSYPRPEGNPLGHCQLCQDGQAETREHFLLTCPALESLRQAWARDSKARAASTPGHARLLQEWATSAHINLAPCAQRPTFAPLTPTHSTLQICALLHPTINDMANDEGADSNDILKTRSKFAAQLEKSTRILIHKMTKLRQQRCNPDQYHSISFL